MQFRTNDSYKDRLQKQIANKISEVGEVEYIYCRREEPVYFVWIIINELDPAVRKRIYAKQRDIIRMFNDEDFDFYVVARMNKPVDSVLKQDDIELIYPMS